MPAFLRTAAAGPKALWLVDMCKAMGWHGTDTEKVGAGIVVELELLKLRRAGLPQKAIAAATGEPLHVVQRILQGIPATLPEKTCSNPNCCMPFTPKRDAWQRYCKRSCYMEHKRRQFS